MILSVHSLSIQKFKSGMQNMTEKKTCTKQLISVKSFFVSIYSLNKPSGCQVVKSHFNRLNKSYNAGLLNSHFNLLSYSDYFIKRHFNAKYLTIYTVKKKLEGTLIKTSIKE